MANLSQQKRERMLAFLETLKKQHNDDDSLIALGEIEKELNSKKYGLVWEEHEEAVDVQMKTHIPVFTEIKEKEICTNANENYNFLLEGDNLHSLYLLEKTHRGKIDVIYIDPPYNTGGKDFIYDDSFVGSDDSFIHSKWLSFMNIRLQIAHEILKDKGVIFISIGDYELSDLKLLCDDIFGEINCLGIVPRLMKTGGNKGRFFSPNIDYVLVYAKNHQVTIDFKGELDEELVKKLYNKTETEGPKKGEKYRPFGLYQSSLDARPNQRYYIECPDGTFVIPPGTTMPAVIADGGKVLPNPEDGCWRWSQERYKEEKAKGNILFTKSKNGVLIQPDGSKSKWNVYTKIWLSSREKEGQTPTNFISKYENRHSAKELKDLGVDFDFAKPTNLIKYLFSLTGTGNEAVILDFFAGSGTTGQAVMELNKQDGGHRKFILCTNNENGICEEVTYQRLKTVITGKRTDGSEYSEGIPANLKYFKTDFISKESEELSDELLEHITEMIELEHGIKVDNKKYVIVLTDEEMDNFEQNISNYPDLKAVFVNQDILLTAKQQKLLDSLDSYIIPDYYFNFELREAGELW